MRHSDLTICLIADEVSHSLNEGLAFAREKGIGTIDLPVIDGRNVLALSRGELADAEPARQDSANQGRSVRL